MKLLAYILGYIVSVGFLFTRTSNSFAGSTYTFYVLSAISVIFLCIFSYVYYSFFENVSIKQLRKMRDNPAVTWFGWFARNLTEWTLIVLTFSPFVLVLLSVSKGISYALPLLSFLQTIAFVISMFVCMFIVFLLIVVFYNWVFTRKNRYLV
ncbi:hypothetical protein AAGG74_17215 [Bacillus mexicanus]|uniref:hypothetical protein n=1 Tax=Bacillus mexicanus TaxID=2834415 RepID=UPI003D25F769